MRRSTPWVDGCCGPMLMIMVSSSGRSMSMSDTSTPAWLSGSRRTEPDLAPELLGRSVVARGELLRAPSKVSRTNGDEVSGSVLIGAPERA